MTQTTQSRSWATLSEAGKDLAIQKPEAEDNRRLMLSVFDSLNDLCEKLSRLDYLFKRKRIKQILCPKGKEKRDED